MNEKLLIRFCLVSVIIGIIIMFFSSRLIEPKNIKISELTEKHNYVKIQGKITELSRSEGGTTFLKIKDDSASIAGVIFKNSLKLEKEIDVGEIVEVVGEVEKYKGELEIIIRSIHLQDRP